MPVSVVVPVFNEEERLGPALERLAAWLGDKDAEVVLSDDGSTDRTRAAAEEWSRREPRIRLLPMTKHLGKGATVRRGMLAATKAAVLFTDADQSTPIEELDALWPHLEAGADVVAGSRTAPGASILVAQPGLRPLAGALFRAAVRASGLTPVRDTQCGFKLFTAAAARDLFSRATLDGFAFDIEILALARARGYTVVEAPVRWSHREPSRLSLGPATLRMACDVALLALRRPG